MADFDEASFSWGMSVINNDLNELTAGNRKVKMKVLSISVVNLINW